MSNSNINIFNTNTIEYEYTIISQIYEKKQIYNTLLKEIKKIITNQINLMYNYFTYDEVPGMSIMEIEKIKKITTSLFKNIAFEAGQVGENVRVYDYTQGKDKKSFTDIKNLQDIINIIQKFNIRECMTVVKNFHRGENHCLMYKIILLFKKYVQTGSVRNFIERYPMLNIDTINESITFIENILGLDILITENHYDKIDFNNKVNKKNKKSFELIERKSRQTLPLYEYLENDKEYRNPVNLCYLWHPLSVQIPYQAITKMMINSVLKDLILSYRPISLMKLNKKQKQNLENCMQEKLTKYPPVPPLSKNEINFLYHTSSKEKKIDTKEYSYVDSLHFLKKIGWTPSICYHEEVVPTSFVLNELKKQKKLSISNYSGHTSLIIMIASYFNDINYDLLLLANMLWTVPYNHSIHEVFMGAKMMNVFPQYRFDNTSFQNVNNLLSKNNLPLLDNKITWDGKVYYYEFNDQNKSLFKKGGKETIKYKWKDISPAKKTLKNYKKKYGNKCFLLPSENKYPVCNRNNGKIDCKGLLAAHNRAMLSIYRKLKPKTYSYKKIAKKARKTAKKYKCNWVK